MASFCSVDAVALVAFLLRGSKPFASQRLPSPRIFGDFYGARTYAQSTQNRYFVVPVFDVTARAAERDDVFKAAHAFSEGVQDSVLLL